MNILAKQSGCYYPQNIGHDNIRLRFLENQQNVQQLSQRMNYQLNHQHPNAKYTHQKYFGNQYCRPQEHLGFPDKCI